MAPVYTASPARAGPPISGAAVGGGRRRRGEPGSRLNEAPTWYNLRMAFRLTPHERGFYPLFTRAAENIAVAADELAKLVAADPAGRPALAARVKKAEHAGDELTHEIMVKINTTFVTPFDREDIYRLAAALDDVVDAIEEAADRIVLYRLGDLPDGIAAQVEVLRRAAAAPAGGGARVGGGGGRRGGLVAVHSP